MAGRSRSRSPGRRFDSDRDRPRRTGGGFRWKDKRRDGDDRAGADEGRLNRGYKDREDRQRSPRRRDRDADRYEDRYRSGGDRDQKRPDGEGDERREKKEKKEKKKKTVQPQDSEPCIIVNVNDRLGTKAAIPCLASDPIKLFKAQVAAQIGREAHQIIIKRQGERPFKDFLTLSDYSISNGAQLDLEVGTGD